MQKQSTCCSSSKNNVFLCDLQVPSLGLVHQGRVLMPPDVEQDITAWSTADSIA
jgi:hypothetical protein